jgi:hypothetical protein
MNARAWMDRTSFHGNLNFEPKGTDDLVMTDAELVKLAAERVMGWQVLEQHGGLIAFNTKTVWKHWIVEPPDDPCKTFPTLGTWNPLTSDTDAMMLVDAIPDTVFTLEHLYAPKLLEWRWLANFGTSGAFGTVIVRGVAASPDRCRAITQAAVRAVGVEVPE